MLSLALVGIGVLAVENAGWDQLATLGPYAVALGLGAYAVYKAGVLPERARYEQERLDRIKAQDQLHEAFEVTTPALHQANANSAAMLDYLRRREP